MKNGFRGSINIGSVASVGKLETGVTMGFYHEPTEETPVDFFSGKNSGLNVVVKKVVLGMLRGR